MKKTIFSAFLAFVISGVAFGGNVLTEKKEQNSFNKTSFDQDIFSAKKRRHSSSSDKVFGIGAQVSILKLFAGNPTLVGFGINALFSPNGEKNAFFADFNYYLSGNKAGMGTAYAFSNMTTPQSIDYTLNNKISGFGFRVGFRRYFINDVSEEGFKMYGQASIGVLLLKATSTSTGGYDQTLYYDTTDPTSTAVGYMIGLGLGAEYNVGSKVGIFAEANINIPANKVNDQEVDVTVPASFQPVLGVRFHF